MRISILIISMTVFSFSVFAQRGNQKKAEKDTVVFFYAAVELSNGLNVLTPIDSIKTPVNALSKTLFQINSANRVRVLRSAQTALGDRELRMKNDKIITVLKSQESLKALKTDLDRFENINKGGIYTLSNYKFVKPNDGEDGRIKKVTVH